MNTDRFDPRRSIRKLICSGSLAAALLVGGAGGLSVAIEIAGAVIAQGTVVVKADVMAVQHARGGIVAQIAVNEGDTVTAGQLLVSLDGTQLEATRAIIAHALDEMALKRNRLIAERDGVAELILPPELEARAAVDAHFAVLVASERTLFALRATTTASQKQQLGEQKRQLASAIEGLDHQLSGRRQELAIVGSQLRDFRDLYSRGLIQSSKLNATERDAAALEGDIGRIDASIAETRGRIAEIEVEILAVEQNLRREVATELGELNARIAEYEERRTAALDEIRRLDLVAPISGTVHELAIRTPGGVVTPGQTVLEIVPAANEVAVETHVSPTEIDLISPGQPVRLRLAAFNRRTTPELQGKVQRIAADATRNEQNGQSYFVVRVAVPNDQLQALGSERIVPGMIADAHFYTTPRTIAAYLLQPLAEQLDRAFRER
jgi:HlyD family secretion protein